MYRALKGVMRVGLLAKGLLLKGDTDVQLIVLCADKPTKRLLDRVYNILLKKIDIVSPQIKYSIILDKLAETIVIIRLTISELQPLITCKVLLTSPTVRTSEEQQTDPLIKSGTYFSFLQNILIFVFLLLKKNLNMNL
jgi:zinc finger RNA-binding protein